MILYISFAMMNDDTTSCSTGHSSTVSKAVTFFSRNSVATMSITSSQYNPPGSGVPTARTTSGAKPSASTVRYTFVGSSRTACFASSAQFLKHLTRSVFFR